MKTQLEHNEYLKKGIDIRKAIMKNALTQNVKSAINDLLEHKDVLMEKQ